MTITELRQVLAAAVLAGSNRVTLTAPKFPRSMPRGELLSENQAGEQNRSIEVWRLVRWVGEIREPAP